MPARKPNQNTSVSAQKQDPQPKHISLRKYHLHKSLLQVSHDFLPDRPLHAEVPLDVLDVVLRQGLAVVHLCRRQLVNTNQLRSTVNTNH